MKSGLIGDGIKILRLIRKDKSTAADGMQGQMHIRLFGSLP